MDTSTSPNELASRIVRITTLSIVLASVGYVGVVAAQASILDQFIRGWINQLKSIFQGVIILAVLFRVAGAFISGAMGSAVKTFALGAVAIVAIEFIDTILLSSLQNVEPDSPEFNETAEPAGSAIQSIVDMGVATDYAQFVDIVVTVAFHLPT